MMQRRGVTPLINTLIFVSRYSSLGHSAPLSHHIAQKGTAAFQRSQRSPYDRPK